MVRQIQRKGPDRYRALGNPLPAIADQFGTKGAIAPSSPLLRGMPSHHFMCFLDFCRWTADHFLAIIFCIVLYKIEHA